MMESDVERNPIESRNIDSSNSLGIPRKKKRCSGSCRKWIGSASFYIYINFFLSQWGDWMWQFAVGLYLVHMDGDRLLLAAIFGFSGGSCVLLFGGVIGDWVDRNPRLRAVRISLFLQNISVSLSAICVCIILKLDDLAKSHLAMDALAVSADSSTTNSFVKDIDKNSEAAPEQSQAAWRIILETGVVATAIAGQMASVAYKIAIEKDWLVVIAAGKSSRLANLNATTRSLDLLCKLIAPITVGVIMTYGSLFVSALCIAIWNIASVFIEYALLSHVYTLVPQLAIKNSTATVEQEMQVIQEEEKEPINSDTLENLDMDVEKIQITLETEKSEIAILPDQNGVPSKEKEQRVEKSAEVLERTSVLSPQVVQEPTCLRKVFAPFIVIVHGWRTYARQKIVFAGMALAFLYMTVLGFDSITVGYIYANNVSALWVGLSMALGGFTGLMGTLLFTRLHRRYGLERTGLIAFTVEISCLTLAVASVWTQGSRFDPHYWSSSSSVVSNITECRNESLVMDDDNTSSPSPVTSLPCAEPQEPLLNISIILLLVGIVLSRVGLWMADLVVTQLMQESIAETERGIVHGVQNSLNMFMDMLKFILVILAPQIEIFGIHIVISFSFICMAGGLFMYHTIRVQRLSRLPNANGIPDPGGAVRL